MGNSILLNPVLIAVLVMIILCLLRFNVLVSIIIATLVGGLLSGMGFNGTLLSFFDGMGNNAETALSYILLGALAYALQDSGVAGKFGGFIEDKFGKNALVLIFGLAIVACFSQNLVPVHIAFIPILIPPLLSLFNSLKIDRRGVACALTFGLKAPYLLIPAGFGAIFQGIVADSVNENIPAAAASTFGQVGVMDVWKSTIIPVGGMVLGLLVAVLISYRKPREYEDRDVIETEDDGSKLTKEQWGAIFGAFTAFAVQLILASDFVGVDTGSLPMGALAGLLVMIAFGTIKISEFDHVIDEGVFMMGFIAFVMLVAAGFANVIRDTGGVNQIVEASASILGGSQLIAAFVLLIIGLLITMGIGTSFGTTPIVAAIYVPLCIELGFSLPATVALVAVAAALGDAGSPASDSTLGPTSGLNADGQHDHIWDTCVPAFLHFNIPLIIFGMIAAMVL